MTAILRFFCPDDLAEVFKRTTEERSVNMSALLRSFIVKWLRDQGVAVPEGASR
jgi:hypothetical protein